MFNFAYRKFFAPKWTVGSLVVIERNEDSLKGNNPARKFLFLKHKFRKKPWAPCGGFCAWPEHPSDTALRELFEETQLLPSELSQLTFLEMLVVEKHNHLENVFYGTTSQEIKKTNLQASEILDFEWLSFEQIAKHEGIIERHKCLFERLRQRSVC